MDTILSGLNAKQREAVGAPDGPLLILAGAGSGKTKTLTHRIAYLIRERGVAPGQILAVTFTNKAAGEMRERVARLLGDGAVAPLVGTFHSVCVRFLRRDIEHIGRAANFTIMDATDQLTVIRRVLKELDLDPKQFSPQGVRAAISRAKNQLQSATDFAAAAGSYYEEIVARIYARYERILQENNSLDFDDLIVFTVRLFTERPDVLARYHEQYRYILVDEYQDTNNMQYRLIALLAARHRNLFIIGDDYQSIYMFRDADITNILTFEKDYPEAQVITLEQNYRSTQNILDAATAVIRKNEHQRHKTLWTEKTGGDAIVYATAVNERGEAGYVAQEILRLHENGRAFREHVVLYRTNAQSRAIEESLLRRDIPYRIVGGTKFYERMEIKDLMAYLRLVYNGADRPALERAIDAPSRGIGPKTLAAWDVFALAHATDPISAGLLLADADTGTDDLTPARRRTIADFAALIARMRDLAATKSLAVLIADLYEASGYKAALMSGENTIENESRHENVGELITIAKEFEGDALTALAAFLEQTALVADTDAIDQADDAVHLMTLHSAKGLEFPVVFMIGLEEGLLPHSRSQLAQRELEEERRLMYVGMTRAMERLYLLHAQSRMVFGSVQANAPSRFLNDVPEALCETVHCQTDTPTGYGARGVGHLTPPRTDGAFGDGTAVRHPVFGDGLIVAQDDTSYTCAFAGKGIKRIAKDFDGLTRA